jgi:hypothetical protein
VAWDQASERLRAVPGVESVALAGWALLNGNGWNGFIWVDGAPTEVLSYFLGVSPGLDQHHEHSFDRWPELASDETYPGVAIVNETFARQCFGGANPVGRWFEKETGNGVTRDRFQVVGLVRDARYRNMREPIKPTAYVPFHSADAKSATPPKSFGAFIVRTSSPNPMALASTLRREPSRAHPEFRVSNLRTQEQLIQQHTVRERLLAMLATFFAVVALLPRRDRTVLASSTTLSCSGGVKSAFAWRWGRRGGEIARRVTVDVFAMVVIGALAGVGLGMVSARYIETLLYQVKADDLGMLAIPSLTILAAALLAGLPGVIRAVRIDPARMLRAE